MTLSDMTSGRHTHRHRHTAADTPQSESYKPEQTLEESTFGSASDLGKGRQIETDSCEDKAGEGGVRGECSILWTFV